MTPNHLSDHEMPLTLPVDPGCLHCHASALASSLPGARNRYAGDPFAYGGIVCESCHGDGSAHAASQGKVQMLRLNSLEPARRDSVCLNCHLEGQTSVDRLGRKPEDFRPGDNLFDYALFLYTAAKWAREGERRASGKPCAERVPEEVRGPHDVYHVP